MSRVHEDLNRLITIPEAAAALDCSEQWIRKLCRDGWIDKPVRGRVSFQGATTGYLRYLDDVNARHAAKVAKESTLNEAKARLLELRIKQKDEQLIDVEECKEMLAFVVATLRECFAEFPQRCTDDPALQAKLRAEIDAILAQAEARYRKSMAEITGRPFDD